jgi:phosphate transport system substrate-binding protein
MYKSRRGVVMGLALTAAACTSLAAAGPALASSSSSSIENPGTASLTETGSTLLYPLWNLWVPGYTKKFPHVTITTAGTGSGTGISEAASGTADIGSSDAYLSPAENKSYPDLKNIPLAISAQFIAYNVPGVHAHLKLNGKVLAEIYQGQVTKWNASAISSINPGVHLPDTPIVTLHRSDSSGDTFLFTSYLSRTNPTGWGTKIGYNTSVSWPNVTGALAEDGNSGMLTGCKDTVGCIAYIGVSYLTQADQDGLGEAEVANGKNQYLLPTSSTIAAAAASFTKKTPADGAISMIDSAASNAYPIINYEYAIVSTHQPSSGTAKAIQSVLQWAVNPSYGNSSQYLSKVNFQPLPKSVMSQSLKQIADIK